MATKKSKQNKVVVSVPKSLAHEAHQLRLYYLRIHDPKERLHVQTVFDGVRIYFETRKQLEYNSNCSLFIYTLDLVLKMDDSKNLLVHHDNAWRQIGSYCLEISRSIHLLPTVTYSEEGNPSHRLNGYLNDEHNFLFDIHFSSRFGLYLPGKGDLQ